VIRLALDKYIFLMNLNDIRPTGTHEASSSETSISRFHNFKKNPAFKLLDELRFYSRVYNMVRVSVRNAMSVLGYGGKGDLAYELRPNKYRGVVSETADRINQLYTRLRARARITAEFQDRGWRV